jgi:ATP-dependent Clp protease ATP-binding subunit ClpA
MVDAQGRVLRFDQAILVFSSNLGAAPITELISRDPAVSYEQIAATSRAAVRDHLVNRLGRPEIYGRVAHSIVPFDILRDSTIDQIVAKIATGIVFVNGPNVQFDLPSLQSFVREKLKDPTVRALGGRQIRNIIVELVQQLARWLTDNGRADVKTVSVTMQEARMVITLDDRIATETVEARS